MARRSVGGSTPTWRPSWIGSHTTATRALAGTRHSRAGRHRGLGREPWDVNSGVQLAVFTGHTNEICKVTFSPDGLTDYSTALDGSLRVWDLSEFIEGD